MEWTFILTAWFAQIICIHYWVLKTICFLFRMDRNLKSIHFSHLKMKLTLIRVFYCRSKSATVLRWSTISTARLWSWSWPTAAGLSRCGLSRRRIPTTATRLSATARLPTTRHGRHGSRLRWTRLWRRSQCRSKRFWIQRWKHSPWLHSQSLRHSNGKYKQNWNNRMPKPFYKLRLSIIFIMCTGSIERFVGIHLFVCLPWGHKTVFGGPSGIVLGRFGRFDCHHDCDGMLWGCSPFIANELHLSGSVHVRPIIYARHNDITGATRNGDAGCWRNGSRMPGSDTVRITNQIRFHHVQWRSLCRIDTIHAVWHCRNVLQRTGHSLDLCIVRRTLVQHVFDLWVSFGLHVSHTETTEKWKI